MARIPLGNFDQVRVRPQTGQGFAPGGSDAVGRAVERLAGTGERMAAQVVDQEAREQAQAQAEAARKHEAMARAQAADAQLDYEIHVKQTAQDVQAQIDRGEIPYQKADDAYTQAVSKIKAPKPDGLDPAMAITFDTGLKRLRANGQLDVRKSVLAAQSADFKSRWSSVLDKLGKLTAMPGADVSKIIAKAEAFVPLAHEAGLNDAQVQADLQGFKDDAWTQQATMRITQAENSTEALQVIEKDLTSRKGFYAGRLDSDKRNALLAKVKTRQEQLANRAAHTQDRANAAASKAIDQIDRQIGSGLAATPEMWAHWADVTRGTDSAQAFQERIKEAKQVQTVLHMSPEVQQTYMQTLEAKLRNGGGSVDQLNHLKHLQTAIAASNKARQDDPLVWNQQNLGDAVQPLNLQQLSDPAGIQKLGAQFQHRAATIAAMRKQYGPQIPMKLLLPQEAQALETALSSATPTDETRLFGLMNKAIDDPEAYNAVMQQLAPKAPVLAYAGMLADRDAQMTVNTHWFGPDDMISSQKVATTMLEGARILAGKGDKTYKAPKDADFRQAFTDAVGDLFRGRPGAAGVAMQAAKTYYVGQAAEDGDASDVVDTTRLGRAIKLTLGDVADVNGNGSVLPPWGMDADTFEQAAHSAWERAAKTQKLPQSIVDGWDDFGLKQAGDHAYYVMNGPDYLFGADQKPIIIDVQPEDAQ